MRQEAEDRLVICRRFQAWEGKKGLDLGGEDKVSLGDSVIKRLDPQPVTGAEKMAAPAVPDGKGVHALQARQASFAPAHIGVQKHLGVCACLKGVTV